MIVAPTVPDTKVVGKPEKKVDALKLVQGKPDLLITGGCC